MNKELVIKGESEESLYYKTIFLMAYNTMSKLNIKEIIEYIKFLYKYNEDMFYYFFGDDKYKCISFINSMCYMSDAYGNSRLLHKIMKLKYSDFINEGNNYDIKKNNS